MKIRISHVSVIAVLLIMISCDNKVGLLPKKSEPLPVNACDSIRYTNATKSIFDKVCTSCHSGPFGSGGVDLSTYSGVLAQVVNGRIKDRITNTSNPMPPSGLMPQPKVDSIMCWINKGGPQ
jgi:cytochrome c5